MNRRIQLLFLVLSSSTLCVRTALASAQSVEVSRKIRRALSDINVKPLFDLPQVKFDPQMDHQFHCSLGNVVSKRDAVERLNNIQGSILTALKDIRDSAALRAYVNDGFPAIPPESVQHNQCYLQEVVTVPDIRIIDAKVSQFVKGIRDRDSYAIGVVHISSLPDNAVFRYTPKAKAGSESPLSTVTNKDLTDVWRGTYEYWVERSGYVAVHDFITLLNGEEVTVSCSLVARSGNDGSVSVARPCTQEINKP
jgi:hypothetical protein